MIDPAKREAFRQVLQKMIDDGADEATIQEATGKFKAKYDAQDTSGAPAGGMGSPKTVEPEAAQPHTSNLFPSSIKMNGSAPDQTGQNPATGISYAPPSGAIALPMLADLLGAPTRALATLNGQKMNEDSYLLKPALEAAQAHPVTPYSGAFAPPPNFAGTSEFAARAASDPLSYAGILAKTLSYIPDMAKAITPSKMIEAAGTSLENVGKSQMEKVVKPLMRHQRSARKPIEQVIFEQGLDKGEGGATSKTIYERSGKKLNELGAKLKAEIRAGRDEGARVNTDQLIDQAVSDLKAAPGSKAAEAGQAPGESEDFYSMAKDIDEIANDFKDRARMANGAGEGNLDLLQAHGFKKYMGHEGAWQQIAQAKGIPLSAKETARSKIAEDIYHRLNDAIDAGAPNGIKDLNRQISELIPVNQAAGWRQVVDGRSNTLGLNDVIGMTATALNPKVWPIVALNKATKSGTVASKIYRLGEAMKSTTPTPKAHSIWAALQKPLGEAQKLRLADLLAEELAPNVQSNAIPFRRKVAEDDQPIDYVTRR